LADNRVFTEWFRLVIENLDDRVRGVRALVQRVEEASVSVGGDVVGQVGAGLCVLIGVTHDDTADLAKRLAQKLWKLRIFEDGDGKMNRSVAERCTAIAAKETARRISKRPVLRWRPL